MTNRIVEAETIYPPHDAHDLEKVEAFAASIDSIPKMVGFMFRRDEMQLITGSHRYEALTQAGAEIADFIYKLLPSDLNYEVFADWDEFKSLALQGGDYNTLVGMVYKDTNNEAVKAILEDQLA